MKHRDTMSTNNLPMLDDGTAFPKKIDWQKWEKEYIQDTHMLTPKLSEVPQKPTVCLDTNVVIGLTLLWSADNGNACQLPQRQTSFKGLRTLQKLIEEDKIKAIVTPYVLQELFVGMKKYGAGFVNYMKNNNVFALDIPQKNDVYYFEDVENVALRYCGRCKNPYEPNPKQGRREENKIFPLAYENQIKRPNIDARIMAEASLLGCPLLTQNIEHFIVNEKDENIARINKEIKIGEGIKPYKPSIFEFEMEVGKKFPILKGKYKSYIKPAKEVEL